MISPIKTVLENLSNKQIIIRVSKRVSVILGAKGGAHSVVEVAGDIFSQAESDTYGAYVLGLVKAGLIKISYTLDKVFKCKTADGCNFVVPYTNVLRDWYMAEMGVVAEVKKAETVAKQEEKPIEKPAEKPVEETKQAEPAQEEKPAEAQEPLKIEEPKQEEPTKVEEPLKIEEPKQEEKPVEETKPAPKAGRKIKVK